MKINDKDRSQLLRMAGNIACGLIGYTTEYLIPKLAAKLAIETLEEVDREIGNINSKEEQ